MKQLPDGWRRVELSELATIKYGKAKPKTDGIIPVIGSGGVYAVAGESLVDFPTVVVGRKGTAGTVWLQEKPCWPSDTAFYLDWLINNKDDLHRFVFYHFQARPIATEHARTTIPSLPRPDLENYILYLPPENERNAIVSILRSVQDAKNARTAETQLERERKAALMAHLFSHGTRGVAAVETPHGKLPRNWEVVKLGEKCEVKGGKRLPKGAKFSVDPTPYPYIRIVNFSEGTVRTENLEYLTPEIQKTVSRYIINEGNVYISIAGSIGLAGTIPSELDGANLTENAAKLIFDSTVLDVDFVALFLAGENGQNQISNFTTKTTQPKLALARIQQIQIPLPPLDEQREIAAILRACDDKIAALEDEVTRLEELFRAMLEELMSGRISVAALL